MGVRGLTTFINNRSHFYLKDHELHDCNLVIDGNSLASCLYKWHSRSNDCFGGDYDKFANSIIHFFNLLEKCHITPYIILDGGYEKRKIRTVVSRMQSKINSAAHMCFMNQASESVFPLFLREIFIDIVLSLNLKVARCEFEGDMEIAALAQVLGCPVLSYDSDFFIFGCLYVPFNTISLYAKMSKNDAYIPCKMYCIDNFLKAFGGLDKSNLPILSVLLGNDYVSSMLFKPFYDNLKMQKVSGTQNDQQRRIKSVIVWLQNETTESAIVKVLSRFKKKKKYIVAKKIERAMKGYNEVSNELLEYFNIRQNSQPKTINFHELIENVPEDDEESAEEDTATLEEDENDEDVLTVPENVFKKKFRNCQYPSCFMDMVGLHTYYCIPQVEETSLHHSHTISCDLIQTIFSVLTADQPEKDLTMVCRNDGKIKYVNIEKINNLPSVDDIQKTTLESRTQLLANWLKIDNNFLESLQNFPKEFHLFLISIQYLSNKTSVDMALVASYLVTFVILNYVDTKIGFFRLSKSFHTKFTNIKHQPVKFTNFHDLSKDNLIFFMSKLISYFEVDLKLETNHRLYDKFLIHSFAEFQSILLHVKYLNALLNNPYPTFEFHKTFSGTFVYNMTVNLKKRSNVVEYLNLLLKDSVVFEGIEQILNFVSSQINIASSKMVKKRRKKNRNKTERTDEEFVQIHNDDDTDKMLDPNNPYSILNTLQSL